MKVARRCRFESRRGKKNFLKFENWTKVVERIVGFSTS